MKAAIIKKYFNIEEWEQLEEFRVVTADIKQISNYTGLSFLEIENLPYFKFMLYRRDAWLYQQKTSEQGREFLKTLKELTTSTADVQAIRRKQREMEGR